MNHEEILKFIKETEREEEKVPREKVPRDTVINGDDIINLRIALNEPAPNGVNSFDHFLNRV